MFSILVMALIVGLSMAVLPKESTKPLLDLLESVQKITLHILLISMKIVPFAVFGLIIGMVATVGVETMVGLGVYMGTVVIGLGIMLLVYALILKFVAKRSISATFSKFRNPQTLAFSTASSMATMPMTLKTAEEDLKIDTRVSKFVIPLGTTVNMDGTALYQVIAVFFLAQLFAIELSMISILVIIITSLLASIGTPAVPGAGVIVLSTILITVGIPPVGILLLLSVDRILDMIRTMVNVTGDLTASEKYISVETYRKNGDSVKTPVWFTIKDNQIFVVTRDQTGKVKRLKNDTQVKIATCTIKGVIKGKWISGTAEILDMEKTKEAVKRRDKKYGFFSKMARFLTKNKGELLAFSIKIK